MPDLASPQLPRHPLTLDFWVRPGASAAALRQRYGDLVQLDRPGGGYWLCASGAAAMKTLLVDDAAKLANLPGWSRVSPAVSEIGKGIIFMDGAEHRWFRQVMTPGFAPAAVADHAPVIHRIARERIARWPRAGTVGLYDEISRIMFAVSASMMLGVDNAAVADELYRVIAKVTLRAQRPDASGLRPQLADALLPIVRARANNPGGDMISRIALAGGADGNKLTDNGLLTHANMMLVLGYFTSSPLCSYMLLKLSEHPDFVERLYKEQTEVAGEDYASVSQMRLLDRALLEAERWSPPLPHLPRRAKADIQCQGHTIRAGEFLLCSLAGTHRDPDAFPDPNRFDPERFTRKRTGKARDPLALAAFGAGPRRCLGTLLARVMIKIVAHHIIRNFRLAPEAEAYAPSFSLPILRPMNAMPMRVERRPR